MAFYEPGCHPQNIIWTEALLKGFSEKLTVLPYIYSKIKGRYDNVTLSPLLLPARVTNRSHSTYGSSAGSDLHRAVFCPNSVVSGWKN
jgi:hypothetical protein